MEGAGERHSPYLERCPRRRNRSEWQSLQRVHLGVREVHFILNVPYLRFGNSVTFSSFLLEATNLRLDYIIFIAVQHCLRR